MMGPFGDRAAFANSAVETLGGGGFKLFEFAAVGGGAAGLVGFAAAFAASEGG